MEIDASLCSAWKIRLFLILWFFNYFYQIRGNGCHSQGDDALQANNHTAVPRTLHFYKDTFVTFEVTAHDAHFRPLAQVHFIRAKEDECSLYVPATAMKSRICLSGTMIFRPLRISIIY